MDHTDLLGDSIEKIAYEKAGIIKPFTPVVISEKQEETTEVFQKVAKSQEARIIFAEEGTSKKYSSALQGEYQRRNIKGVIAVVEALTNFKVQEEHILRGLARVVENTGLMGRWQLLGEHPRIIADTAHNSEGIRLVMDQLSMEDFDELYMVLGFVKEKNLDQILPMFPKKAHYLFCRPDIPRGMDADLLQRKAAENGLKGSVYDSVSDALETAKKGAKKNDLIFVGGSNFTVAEVV
jgi:dihydrofolate synthase/folylpolyglutamate synthase